MIAFYGKIRNYRCLFASDSFFAYEKLRDAVLEFPLKNFFVQREKNFEND